MVFDDSQTIQIYDNYQMGLNNFDQNQNRLIKVTISLGKLFIYELLKVWQIIFIYMNIGLTFFFIVIVRSD